jgi:hypothetical protein
LAGIAKLADLKGELGLTHDLLEVLEAWPGGEPGVVIIDALDASRGGPSEAAFASLIELALPRLGERSSIVASIRTFDLLNGRRFRETMQGAPPNPAYAEQKLGQALLRQPRGHTQRTRSAVSASSSATAGRYASAQLVLRRDNLDGKAYCLTQKCSRGQPVASARMLLASLSICAHLSRSSI